MFFHHTCTNADIPPSVPFVSFSLYSSSAKYIRTHIVRFQPTSGTAMRLIPTLLLVGGASVPFAQAQTPFQPLKAGDSCPTGDYVDCRSGIAYDPITNVPIINGGIPSSCFAACNNGEECCFGTEACFGTTACIEKSAPATPAEDRTCSGFGACANVGNPGSKPIISSGSCRGTQACFQLAASAGSVVTSIKDSCTANHACSSLAVTGGSVTSIEDSCTAESACYRLAADEGSVTSIEDSCTANQACYRLAIGAGSVVTSIVRSCTGDSACLSLAYGGGSVTSGIVDSCTADAACQLLAVGGSVGAITGSCCEADSCREHCSALSVGPPSSKFPTLTCGSDLTNVGGCVSTTSIGTCSFALSMCFFHTVSSCRPLSGCKCQL